MKRYKTVAGPLRIGVSKGNVQGAFDMFASIINSECVDGWEYHSMETISVTEKPGCFFQQPTTTQYYMLIFQKEI